MKNLLLVLFVMTAMTGCNAVNQNTTASASQPKPTGQNIHEYLDGKTVKDKNGCVFLVRVSDYNSAWYIYHVYDQDDRALCHLPESSK